MRTNRRDGYHAAKRQISDAENTLREILALALPGADRLFLHNSDGQSVHHDGLLTLLMVTDAHRITWTTAKQIQQVPHLRNRVRPLPKIVVVSITSVGDGVSDDGWTMLIQNNPAVLKKAKGNR